MRKNHFFAVLALFATTGLVILNGCSRSSYTTSPVAPTPTPGTPSWSTTIFPMFQNSSPTCFSCHQNGGADAGNMNMGSSNTASSVYTAWFNVPVETSFSCAATYIYAPSNAASSSNINNSEIYQAVNGSCSGGAKMPDGGTAFTTAQLSELAAWINAGAPNN